MKNRMIWCAACLLLITLFLGYYLTPRVLMSAQRPVMPLAQWLPAAFSGWEKDPRTALMQVSPEVEGQLNAIYSDIFAQTYVNAAGQHIMLSLAYGGTQNRTLQVHRPEVCYASQGFQIANLHKETLSLASAQLDDLPVMRLTAVQGGRREYITYWIVFGNTIVRGNMEQGLARWRYGAQGLIPDALLVRISSIGDNEQQEYALQTAFIQSLLGQLAPTTQTRLLGKK